uniref:Immunoglobulin I-set domain-containing protein n=1 Tax=Amphilophus citrinellus TaxID=61819 RepID=A0A3Q0RDB3_AMPCI
MFVLFFEGTMLMLVDLMHDLAISCLTLLLGSVLSGGRCELLVLPAGLSLVNALAGSNVTLAVSFSGASDPVVTWFKGVLHIATWTISSSADPSVAGAFSSVLRTEKNGSLTFVNVPLNYTGDYTIEIVKSGMPRVSTTFTLKIFGE